MWGTYLCPRCISAKIQTYPVHVCHVCRSEGRKFPVHTDCSLQTYLDGVIVCAVYNDFLKSIIHEVKYKFSFAVCGDLAKLMSTELCEWNVSFDVITDIPLTPARKRWRGFNQAQVLARRISRDSAIPYLELLGRQKVKYNQVGLDKVERSMNLFKAFYLPRPLPANVKRALIVDDVMTTGATLEQCARTLKSAGVEQVWGIVLARGL